MNHDDDDTELDPDDWDPTGYYRRKLEREAETWPALSIVLWALATMSLGMLVAALLCADVAQAQEEPIVSRPCNADNPAPDCQVWDVATVWTQTGTERSVGWCEHPDDVANMALFYQVELLEFPPKDDQLAVWAWEAEEGTTRQSWIPDRAGGFWLNIRACRTDIDPETAGVIEHPTRGPVLCGAWNRGLDPQTGADCGDPAFPRGFVVRVDLAPASGGGIE